MCHSSRPVCRSSTAQHIAEHVVEAMKAALPPNGEDDCDDTGGDDDDDDDAQSQAV